MAVGRLSLRRVLETLKAFPEGVPRRELLDHFARTCVTERSSPGAKGRLARRLYSQLEKLGRKGLVEAAEGRVVLLPAAGPGGAPAPERPLLTAQLRRLLFTALRVEDRSEGGSGAPELVRARQAFLAEAAGAGWTDRQIALELGVGEALVRGLRAPAAPDPGRPWHVYILRCADGTLYTGIALDVAARFEQHRAGKGAKYTRGRGALEVVHQEEAGSRGQATRRERAIKRLTRAGKLALVRG
jgi:putative endonuclease